MNPNSWEKAI